jgi:hypothetical protein
MSGITRTQTMRRRLTAAQFGARMRKRIRRAETHDARVIRQRAPVFSIRSFLNYLATGDPSVSLPKLPTPAPVPDRGVSTADSKSSRSLRSALASAFRKTRKGSAAKTS